MKYNASNKQLALLFNEGEYIMSCRYVDFYTGKCQLYCEGIEEPGCDEKGYCICSDDECPLDICEKYNCDDCFYRSNCDKKED